MKIFGKGASDASRRARKPEQKDDDQALSHRITLDLKRAQTMAAMLAHSRSSNIIEVADVLAGIYISNWDRMSRYWTDGNEEMIESFLRKICQISPQRWHSWIESYHNDRHDDEKRAWNLLRRPKNGKPATKPPQPSADLLSVLKIAEQLTSYREKSNGRLLPILTTESVLLSILRNVGSEISRRLAESGIDEARLQRDVLLPRRARLT